GGGESVLGQRHAGFERHQRLVVGGLVIAVVSAADDGADVARNFGITRSGVAAASQERTATGKSEYANYADHYFATFKIRLLRVSMTKRFPWVSNATPKGRRSCVSVAGRPSSSLSPSSPVPTTVRMTPLSRLMARTAPLSVSAKYRSPSGPISRSWGLLICASMAGPSSPLKPAVPVPASVSIMPVARSMTRMRLLIESEM